MVRCPESPACVAIRDAVRTENAQGDEFTCVATSPCRWRCYDGGNFYKTISFQTIPEDNSAPIGFSVSIDDTMLFAKGFTPGRKVYIKLKDLYVAKMFGSMQIGLINPDDSSEI